MLCLMRQDGMCNVNLKRMRFHRDKFARMMQVGLPAGLQSVIFNISNVLIQSSVNSFGATVVADVYKRQDRRKERMEQY